MGPNHYLLLYVVDDEGNPVEAKTALQNKRQDNVAVTGQASNKEKAND